MTFWDEYGVYVNVVVAVVSAVFFAVVILQIVYIQSKIDNARASVPKVEPPSRIPFGLFAVYVDNVATSNANRSKITIPPVSITYYANDVLASSFPITTSYVPTKTYYLVLKPTASAESLKLMVRNNNANNIIISKKLFGITIFNDNLVLYAPLRTGAGENDILQIASFAGVSTSGNFDELKTLSPAIPVHVLAYKV